MTTISRMQPTLTPAERLRAYAALDVPPPWHDLQPAIVALLDEHRDRIEELEVALHNARRHKCASCREWIPIEDVWCLDCLRESTWVSPRMCQRDIDVRENPRVMRGAP